jgi:hypothetical protein
MKTRDFVLPVAALAGLLFIQPTEARLSAGPQETLQEAEEAVANTLVPGGSTAQFAALEMLRLRDGRVLWAQISDHTPELFVVERLDNGGIATLPWSYLDPTQELELKRRYGYVEIELEELTVDASVIPLVDGTELIGVIELATDDTLHIKSETGLLVLPRSRVSGTITATRVPARDIYSRQELYERQRGDLALDLLGSGQTAIDANLELASYCERILDYVKAVEHYEAALALGADDTQIETQLGLAERRAEAQSQVDALDHIDRLRRQGQFPEAVLQLDVFVSTWPASPLLDEWAALNQRVMSDREKDVLRLVRDRWFYWMSRAIRDAAKDMTYEQAQAFAEELGQVILARVTEDVQKLWPEASSADVCDLFARRERSRTRGATFGAGTFLLGKERATAKPKDEQDEDESGAPLSALDQQRKELQDRLEGYLENRRRQSGGASAGQSAVDPAQFWLTWNVSGKSQWLTSYYAEFSGDLEFLRATVEPHSECGGTGYLEIIGVNAGGGNQRRLIPDPACGGVGVKRRVKFR